MTGLSVILPVYNGERYIAEALASVAAQSLRADEIIVVDDGSTDGSRAVAVEQGLRNLRVLHQANQGCAAARNAGIAAATCDIIAFLDHDDTWLPERLALAHAELARDPGCDFVVCAQQNFLSPELSRPPRWLEAAALVQPQHGFSTNALMARRAAFARVGPFDPAHMPLDDSDWLVRALDAGLRYVHLDTPLVRRRIHARNITGNMRGTPAHAATMARILHASLARRRGVASKP